MAADEIGNVIEETVLDAEGKDTGRVRLRPSGEGGLVGFLKWAALNHTSAYMSQLGQDGAFGLLAIMDIRARSISFTTRPRRPYGPPDHERAGETFSPSPLFDSQTSAGNPLLLLGLAGAVSHPWRT
jgi:hypothetical protein